jgi:hypothetical protein
MFTEALFVSKKKHAQMQKVAVRKGKTTMQRGWKGINSMQPLPLLQKKGNQNTQ